MTPPDRHPHGVQSASGVIPLSGAFPSEPRALVPPSAATEARPAGRPTIAVVIPVFNRENVIRRALESVLSQTVSADEIIVVDDGSTDATADVVQSVAASSPTISLVRQRNAGPAASRNQGIAASTSEWIAFLDSDDEWAPGKLEHALEVILHDPAIDFVHGNCRFVDGSGGGHAWDAISPSKMVDKRFLLEDYWIKVPAVLIRRALLDRLGGGFRPDLRSAEDFELWWRAIVEARAIGYIRHCDVSIHMSADGITRSNKRRELMRNDMRAMQSASRWIGANHPQVGFATLLQQRIYWMGRNMTMLALRRLALLHAAQDLAFLARMTTPLLALRAGVSALLAACARKDGKFFHAGTD